MVFCITRIRIGGIKKKKIKKKTKVKKQKGKLGESINEIRLLEVICKKRKKKNFP